MSSKKLPPLGPLPSFCAAAKHQSFTKAAQELNLTHGAVSRAVLQLEQYFDQPLFYRRNRRVYLTEKGAFFAEKASELLADLATVTEQMKVSETGNSLSISCEPSLAMRWLMPRLGSFYEQFPGTDIQLSTAGGPVDLASQQLDLAIRRSDFQWPADYWVTSLGRERIGPVCHLSYWQKLSGDKPVFLHTRTRPQAWSDWQSCSGKVISSSSEQYFDHFYFSLQAAVAGLGMAIGPEPLVADDLQREHLIAPFGFVETEVDYVVLSLMNPERNELLNAFLTWLQTELSMFSSH